VKPQIYGEMRSHLGYPKQLVESGCRLGW